ncbi:fibrinogen-like YCDxxxxGGGW domain-containing protein [Bdellovibrio sp. HCB337]|uniref:fibrinogen-like YCDxxxxGGGW domain-containing protein n=1 Tax=Bdellovibrio sp. HCB337 TaxID=3394358 RepID=UPI0039A451F9
MKYLTPATADQPEILVDSFEFALNLPTTYKNCQDALNAGNTISDIYLVDPDGNGGLCPFKVYCDMNPSSGRARALIGRASTHGYTELPRLQVPLETQGHGLLQHEHIAALYNSTGSTKKMTVDVEEASMGNLSVPLNITNINQTQQLANATYCEYNNTNAVNAIGTNSTEFKIGAQNNTGFVGFSTEVVNGKVTGFSCANCSTDYVCSLGGSSCCQQQLKGSLWLE